MDAPDEPERGEPRPARAACPAGGADRPVPRPDRPGLLPQDRTCPRGTTSSTKQERWDVQARFWEAVAPALRRQPGRLLLRPDERAGRPRRQAQGRRLARPARSAASTSSSSSRSTRPAATADGDRPRVGREAGRRHPQARQAAPHHRRPGDWSRPQGLTPASCRRSPRPRLRLRPPLPREGQDRRGAEDARRLRRRQAGGDRGDVPAEVRAESSASSSTARGTARPAVDRLLLGQDARQSCSRVEGDPRPAAARWLELFQELHPPQ